MLIFIHLVYKKKAGIHSMSERVLAFFFEFIVIINDGFVHEKINLKIIRINKNSIDLINIQTYTNFNLFQR